jgi:hypothetical protein
MLAVGISRAGRNEGKEARQKIGTFARHHKGRDEMMTSQKRSDNDDTTINRLDVEVFGYMNER